MRGTMLLWVLVALPLLAEEKAVPWLGVSMTVEGTVPEVEGRKFDRAIRVHEAVPGSPADKAGLRAGDLLVEVEGVDFAKDAEGLLTRLRDAIAARTVGDTLAVAVVRDSVDRTARLGGEPLDDPAAWADPEAFLRARPPGAPLELTALRKVHRVEFRVTLEARPQLATQAAMPPNAEILPEGVAEPPEEALAAALREELGIEADYQDLLSRLAKLHEQADPFRLRRFAYAHRAPFRMAPLARAAAADMLTDGGFARAFAWLDRPPAPVQAPLSPAGLTIDQRVDEILERLGRARACWDRAFAGISREERDFALKQLAALSDAFVDTLVLQSDEKRERIEPNLRLTRLAARVDFAALFEAALFVQEVQRGADWIRADLEAAWEAAGRPADVFFTRDSSLGKVVIGGKGRTWYREDAAVLIDLGGNDFYTNNAGTSAGDALPLAILIDYDGDDAYEATFDWTQGGGRLGVGALLDCAGNDSYIGRRWAQGACAIGVGSLTDLAGNDTYRGGDYVQAAALWGVAMLEDRDGTDSYESTRYAQSCAMPGGLAILDDRGGDDRYYCKGLYPTGYGDAGIFDAFGQACGIGFRGLLSGGLALLVDHEGRDRYEAGNFSQGGGYYFGWGVLMDGEGDDQYIGSRYNQGFAAHEAMGYFEDVSGNDVYDTRQGVAQGLSWDETVVAFRDGAGNDEYHGGGFFSLGAVAHNGWCLFVDMAGDDLYDYAPGPAQVSGNEYHGGTSFGLFVDAGGGTDHYTSVLTNDEVRASGQHGVACDLPGGLDPQEVRALLKK